MGGLVIDVFLVYLFRTLLRKWRQRGTSQWEARKAQVASISSPLVWGCPVVEVVYLYRINEETYSGLETVPFIWLSSAEDYVRRNPQQSILIARVKPGDPARSTIRNEDQVRMQVSE